MVIKYIYIYIKDLNAHVSGRHVHPIQCQKFSTKKFQLKTFFNSRKRKKKFNVNGVWGWGKWNWTWLIEIAQGKNVYSEFLKIQPTNSVASK